MDGTHRQSREAARAPDHAAPQAGDAKPREAAGALARPVMVRPVLELADTLREPAWRDPAVLASLADRRIKATREELREALRGRPTAHHRLLLQLHLEPIDALNRAIARIDEAVKSDLDSFREAAEIVKTIPGFDDLSAQSVKAPAREGPPDAQRLALAESDALLLRLDGSQNQGQPSRPSSIESRPAAAPKRRSAPSPPPSCAPSITCSRMEPSTRIWAPTTSTSGTRPPPPAALSSASRTSGSPSS